MSVRGNIPIVRPVQLAYVSYMCLIGMVAVGALSFPPRPTIATHRHDERRDFLGKAVVTISALALPPLPVDAAAVNQPKLCGRLEDDVLVIPPPSYTSELKGVDNTYFPSFLAGDWQVTQTLVDTKAPLGLKFVGGPNGNLSIAENTIDEARSRLNIPVKLRLRYLSTKWGVAEDRLFNNEERLNAFAGKDVVASVQYANVGGSNRQSVLAMGGTEQDPLQTTIVYFKGPVAQKSFVTSSGKQQLSETSWVGYEVQRSIFALTNQNPAPPITTDSEYIWSFEQVNDGHVRGKLRIAGYLNAQSDSLFFEARNRAVSLQDYVLDMTKIK